MSPAGRTGLAILLASAVIAGFPSLVQAEVKEPDGNNLIGPTTSGPYATEGSAGFDSEGIAANAASRKASADGSTTAAYAGTGYSGSGYTYYTDLGAYPACSTVGLGLNGWVVYGPDGSYAANICSPQSAAAPVSGGVPLPPAAQLAQQANSRQPWADLVVGINPGIGMTGLLPSWFWIEGGSAAIPPATASAGPLTVTVRATLVDVLWDFGDGSAVYDSGSSLGRAYPEESDIAHLYETDSYGLESYTVSATFRYGVSYSVNGGPWQALGSKATTYSRTYQVIQVQPKAVRAQ